MDCTHQCQGCRGCPDIYQPEYLTATCGRENEIEFFRHTAAGFPCVRLTCAFGTAEISLYGAHLLNWTPTGAKPVIFMSKDAIFFPGKAIRGGIPICWPWFGACKENPANPAHGFARISFWNLYNVANYPDGRKEASFILKSDEQTKKYWNHDFEAILTVTIGWELTIKLTITNTGKELLNYTEALHTYFNVGDASQTRLHGLENTTYLDATDAFTPKSETDSFVIDGKFDRVYQEHIAPVEIEDVANNRTLLVTKKGSLTTVVWNPGEQDAKSMKDFGDEEFRNMVCVEAANAWGSQICLLPGETHTTSQTIIIK